MRTRPAGLGGKDPPITVNAGGAASAAAAPARPTTPPPPPKQKFFPIPIPREPEWVAGAHGDRISLGKTVFVLEREGGPEPTDQRRRRPVSAAGSRAGAIAAAAAAEAAAAAAAEAEAAAVAAAEAAAAEGAEGVEVGAGAAGSRPARVKKTPAVISKGFTANPNLVSCCCHRGSKVGGWVGG